MALFRICISLGVFINEIKPFQTESSLSYLPYFSIKNCLLCIDNSNLTFTCFEPSYNAIMMGTRHAVMAQLAHIYVNVLVHLSHDLLMCEGHQIAWSVGTGVHRYKYHISSIFKLFIICQVICVRAADYTTTPGRMDAERTCLMIDCWHFHHRRCIYFGNKYLLEKTYLLCCRSLLKDGMCPYELMNTVLLWDNIPWH